MDANLAAIGVGTVAPATQARADILLATRPQRVILWEVDVPGQPAAGKMELVRQGMGEAYFAKDSRGTLYPLQTRYSDHAATEEIRSRLRGGGYTHAIGRRAVPLDLKFLGNQVNPFLNVVNPLRQALQPKPSSLSLPTPQHPAAVVRPPIAPPALRAEVEQAVGVRLNSRFTSLHQALASHQRGQVTRQQLNDVLAELKAFIAKVGWSDRLTPAQSQAIRTAREVLTPPTRTQVHRIAVERPNASDPTGRPLRIEAELRIRESRLSDGRWFIDQAHITSLSVDNLSGHPTGRHSKVLPIPRDVGRGNGFHGKGVGVPLKRLDDVLKVARDALNDARWVAQTIRTDLPQTIKGAPRMPAPVRMGQVQESIYKGLARFGSDFVSGLVHLALVPLSGLGELVNLAGMGLGQDRLLIPAAHQYASRFRQGLDELISFVVRHPDKLATLPVTALMRELQAVQTLMDKGDLLGATERITHVTANLISALYAVKGLPQQTTQLLKALSAGAKESQRAIMKLQSLPAHLKGLVQASATRLPADTGMTSALQKLGQAVRRAQDMPASRHLQSLNKALSEATDAYRAAAKTLTPEQKSLFRDLGAKANRILANQPPIPPTAQPQPRTTAVTPQPPRSAVTQVGKEPPVTAAPLPPGWRVHAETTADGGRVLLQDSKGLTKGAAFFRLVPDRPGVARITGINIATDARGQGMGLRVLEEVERRLGGQGTVLIEVSPLPEVSGFYEKAGYRPDPASFMGNWIKRLATGQSGAPVRGTSGGPVSSASGAAGPGSPAVAEPWKRLATGVYASPQGRIRLESVGLRVDLPAGWTFGSIEDWGSYTTISGHGSMRPNELLKLGVSPMATVPPGTQVVVLTPPGGLLGGDLADAIDGRIRGVRYGVDEPVVIPIRLPYRVLQPGETLPNHIVTSLGATPAPPRSDVITVAAGEGRPLSALLAPDMGTVVINVCAQAVGVPRTRWSDLVFGIGKVRSLADHQSVYFGRSASSPQGMGHRSAGTTDPAPGGRAPDGYRPAIPAANTPEIHLVAQAKPTDKAVLLMEGADGFRPVPAVPVLDPPHGYVLIVVSLPGQAPKIAWRPGFEARRAGELVPFAATARSGPHFDMQQSLMPSSVPDVTADNGYRPVTYLDEKGSERSVRTAMAAGYLQFNADGTATLITKSGWHNKEVERLGRLVFPRNTDPRNSHLVQMDGDVAREFARLVADATGLPVRLGDPLFAGRDDIVRPRSPLPPELPGGAP